MNDNNTMSMSASLFAETGLAEIREVQRRFIIGERLLPHNGSRKAFRNPVLRRRMVGRQKTLHRKDRIKASAGLLQESQI